MKIGRGLAVVMVTGASLFGIGTAPAFADGPPVPPGCSFDHGVLTCVTTTTATSTIGPFTTNGYVPTSTSFGGFTGEQICQVALASVAPPDEQWAFLELTGMSLIETVTTTTTAERHGLNGEVFNVSASTSASLDGVRGSVGGSLECYS